MELAGPPVKLAVKLGSAGASDDGGRRDDRLVGPAVAPLGPVVGLRERVAALAAADPVAAVAAEQHVVAAAAL